MATGMASVNGERGPGDHGRLSALPSVQARLLAFVAILIAGLCGGLIGFSAVRVGCHGSCATPEGVGGLTGALIAAIGVSVIAVLVLRAMGEWRTITEKRQLELMIAAAGAFSEEEASQRRLVVEDEPPAEESPPDADGGLGRGG